MRQMLSRVSRPWWDGWPGEVSNGRVLQHDPPVVRTKQSCGMLLEEGREDIKRKRPIGCNLVRAESYGLCIIEYEKKGNRSREWAEYRYGNECISFEVKTCLFCIQYEEDRQYSRSEQNKEIELAYSESRGYWTDCSPGNWYKQAKSIGKINNVKETLYFFLVLKCRLWAPNLLVRLVVFLT